ncbi:hypothetical protein PsAD5_00558 [Pseudovibrio sp. Ad5]|uniref:DUF4238 domain-containing protein n=1 Tax=Pseudovibrio sp. Ad5 TaxID=989436 RepID=UPI0007AE78E9|nr:DUF4238 domain-containing protein [Pseudovibrio sp. Ad5]KZL01636.1 hypothetical protein PsAD5_00558 [Pseudovibrio sp. Ad5]
MSDPIRHHYMPRFILGKFVNSSDLLWVRRQGKIFQTGINNVFVKKELNTFIDKKGNKERELEKKYSQIESDTAPITKKIIEFTEKNIYPNISENEKYTWNVFFFHQHSRAPDSFLKLGINSDFDEVWARETENFEKYAGQNNIRVDPEELKRVKDPANFGKFKQNTSVLARKNLGHEVLQILDRRGLAYGIIRNQSDEFIIGDHPFVRLQGTGNLKNPATELWFPISPKVAISPYGKNLDRKLIELTSSQVHLINSTIFEQSNIIASKQRSIIEGLLPQTSP